MGEPLTSPEYDSDHVLTPIWWDCLCCKKYDGQYEDCAHNLRFNLCGVKDSYDCMVDYYGDSCAFLLFCL